MAILHPDIRQFIEQMTKLRAIGTLRVPRAGLKELIGLLEKASIIVGKAPAPGRATYRVVDRSTDFTQIAPPAILVVTEEDFDDPAFAAKLRAAAPYFFRLGDVPRTASR